MSILVELMNQPGVLAAGQYAFRGDRFTYRGALTEEYARMASIMCRAGTLGASMAGEMLAALRPGTGIHPVQGWLIRGPGRSMCVVANVFCFIDNETGSLDAILQQMRRLLAGSEMDLM